MVFDGDNSSVKLTVDSKSVYTGDNLRDEHLSEEGFFHVEKYPQISFKASSQKENVFKGELTLIETSKALEVPFKVKVIDGIHHLQGEVDFDRVEYGMESHKLAPDDIKIKFDIILEKK